MALNNYSALQATIATWLWRTDVTAEIRDCIAMAEASLNKVLRTRYMIGASNISFSAGVNVATIPTDVIDINRIVGATDATQTLVKVPIEYIDEKVRLRQSRSGTPLYYAVNGDQLVILPVPSEAKTYSMSAFREIPALSDSNTSNWLLTHHPDLYLYTSLMHAYPLIKDEARAEVMGNKMVQMVQALLQSNQTTTLEGSPADTFKG